MLKAAKATQILYLLESYLWPLAADTSGSGHCLSAGQGADFILPSCPSAWKKQVSPGSGQQVLCVCAWVFQRGIASLLQNTREGGKPVTVCRGVCTDLCLQTSLGGCASHPIPPGPTTAGHITQHQFPKPCLTSVPKTLALGLGLPL